MTDLAQINQWVSLLLIVLGVPLVAYLLHDLLIKESSKKEDSEGDERPQG